MKRLTAAVGVKHRCNAVDDPVVVVLGNDNMMMMMMTTIAMIVTTFSEWDVRHRSVNLRTTLKR